MIKPKQFNCTDQLSTSVSCPTKSLRILIFSHSPSTFSKTFVEMPKNFETHTFFRERCMKHMVLHIEKRCMCVSINN